METGGSSGSSQRQTLKLSFQFGQEQEIYFEDVDAKSGGGLPPPAGGDGGSAPQKKGKAGAGAGVQGQQPPRCQVEGCNVDLSNAKTYYSRHKVCGVHSKTPVVTVNGLHQRFCQQCSRFHQLTEFDQGKRSCRKRLAGHNERRRKPPPGTILSACYRSPPSSIFARGGSGRGRGSSRGLLMDFTTYSSAPLQWPNTRASTAIEKHTPFQWQSNLDNPPPEGCFNGVSNSDCALSLLSNQSSGSRNHTSSLACYVGLGPNSEAAHMVQPAGEAMAHLSSTASWGYDTDGTLMVWDQSQQSAYPGELRLGQQHDSFAKSL